MSKDPSHDDDNVREMFQAARRADAQDAPDLSKLTVTPGSPPPLVRRWVWATTSVALVLVTLAWAAWVRPDRQAAAPDEAIATLAPIEQPSVTTIARTSDPASGARPQVRGYENTEATPTELKPSTPNAPASAITSTLTKPTDVAVARPPVPGEPDNGLLRVNVTDTEGAALPGATVTLLSKTDGNHRTVVSGKDGVARIDAPSGEYEVQTGFPSFTTRREDGVRVAEGEEQDLEVRLYTEAVGRVKVVPAGQVPQVDSASTRFTDEFVSDLPVPGQLYQNVMTLAPGISGPDGAGNPIVHGSRSRDFQAQAFSGQSAALVDPNSIEEMEVITGGASVEVGKAQGGFANIVQKQGAGIAAQSLGFVAVPEPPSTERYDPIQENEFERVTDAPLSTFSIDVDTASYSNLRRFLRQGQLPPAGAIRIEEWINYFDYDDPAPTGDEPFSVTTEMGDCPWEPDHKLMRIGLKAREIERGEIPGTNLVFLIDVSGSMNNAYKLPLLQKALRLLVDQLDGGDRVAMVVYAGSSGLVLPSTSNRGDILDALDRLRAGGSTNGGAGIDLAYKVARENFVPGGVNRVILATDGDFNVGLTDRETLLRRIKRDADEGVFLTALGFGMGNLNDSMLETLADKGNGNYAYIDSLQEAKKVLVEQIGGTLVTVAKDVKIQVEFNPNEVAGYRLIGYENRMLAAQDFNDDRKDAGEIGAGHSVTALYELIPTGLAVPRPATDPLKYQAPTAPPRDDEAHGGEWLTVKLRYKEPEGRISRLIERPFTPDATRAPSVDFDFAACVAAFGMALRDSEHAGRISLDDVEALAERGRGADRHGYRRELIELVREAKTLMGSR